jgi:type IV pilus assembly protein PilE
MFTDPYKFAAVVTSLVPGQVLRQGRPESPHRPATRAGVHGFTLVELMIVIAIVALLVGVALPSYRDHIRKSRRAEAQAYLMAIAGRQQQFLVDSRGYAATLATINIPAPANVVAAYDVTLAAVTGPPPTFLLTAAPKAGTDQTLERCGTLTIDQTGAKTASLTSCW